MTTNPFTEIENRLLRIEALLSDLTGNSAQNVIKRKWIKRNKEMDEYLRLFAHKHTNGERLTLEGQQQIVKEIIEDLGKIK